MRCRGREDGNLTVERSVFEPVWVDGYVADCVCVVGDSAGALFGVVDAALVAVVVLC